MWIRHCMMLLLAGLAVALPVSAHAYPEYRVTIVGPPNSWVAGINHAGVVVGSYPVAFNVNRAFLNRGQGLVDLGALGGVDSGAVAINDRGEVLGNWRTAAGQTRGFIYSCGKARDIGVIPGRSTSYADINNAGYIVVGGGALPDGSETRSYLRAPNGALTDLGWLPVEGSGPAITGALALNNRNEVTGLSGRFNAPEPGFRAFGWRQGAIRDLGDLGSMPNRGTAINDLGQITGEAGLPAGPRDVVAFLVSHGRMISLDDRPATEYKYSGGTGINNHGHVVGFSNHLSGFIWRGRRMESLNALVDPALGWNISNLRAINDAGQIAAIAVRGGVSYSVRLDLIRPHALAAMAPDPLAADEAEAQARELVRPLAQ